MEKVSYSVLRELYKKTELDIGTINTMTNFKDNEPNPYTQDLLKDKLVSHYSVGAKSDGAGGFIDGTQYWRITLAGKGYIEKRRKDLLMFWLPYSITTLIAVAALLEGLFS